MCEGSGGSGTGSIHHYGRYPSTSEYARVCEGSGGSGIGSFDEIILSRRTNSVMCGECLKRIKEAKTDGSLNGRLSYVNLR